MLDKPTGDDLLLAVLHFLRNEAMPLLDGAAAFKVRVAANALELVHREIEGAGDVEAAEAERLTALLNQNGTIDELNRVLCEAIRSGRMDLSTPGLPEHLWQTTLDKIAIEQPTNASYRSLRAAQRD